MIHREDAEAKALIQWADLVPIIAGRLVHVPNGGRRNPREAGRLKAMGVRAGYPDFLLDVPHGGRHGLRLELKARRPHHAAITRPQAEWIEYLVANGYACRVCYGWEDAKDFITRYLASGNVYDLNKIFSLPGRIIR